MNRVFVTGDTHGSQQGDLDKLTSRRFPEGKELTKDDFVIVAGDFGFLWSPVASDSEKNKYKWFEEKPWTTLFIDGNHENFNRLDALPDVEMFDGVVGKVNDSIYHLRRGYVYEIAGRSIFTFGGGYSIDKNGRLPDVEWWEREMPSKSEYDRGLKSLAEYKNKVDYIITHSCSNNMFLELSDEYNMFYKIEGEEQLRDFLDIIELLVERKHWYYGHFHEDHKFENHTVLYDIVRELT